MANGTLIDEATYYGDTENYIGSSGSETNMWVIEDCYDFIDAITKSTTDSAQYIRLVNDIDFNNHLTYKYGFEGAIVEDYNCYLYGDGHKIINIISVNTTAPIFNFNIADSVDFVNLICVNCTVFPISITTATNCNFGVFFSNSAFSLQQNTFTDCTFNVKGNGRNGSLIKTTSCTFERCHFNFDISIKLRINSANATGMFQSASSSSSRTYFDNCYVTGVIKDLESSTKPYFNFGHTNFTNCYLAFEYSGTAFGGTSNMSINAVCFIDKDLCEKNGTVLGSIGFTSLTTAQAQDANYLNSIGFPVIQI